MGFWFACLQLNWILENNVVSATLYPAKECIFPSRDAEPWQVPPLAFMAISKAGEHMLYYPSVLRGAVLSTVLGDLAKQTKVDRGGTGAILGMDSTMVTAILILLCHFMANGTVLHVRVFHKSCDEAFCTELRNAVSGLQRFAAAFTSTLAHEHFGEIVMVIKCKGFVLPKMWWFTSGLLVHTLGSIGITTQMACKNWTVHERSTQLVT